MAKFVAFIKLTQWNTVAAYQKPLWLSPMSIWWMNRDGEHYTMIYFTAEAYILVMEAPEEIMALWEVARG